jgi:alpha-ribazole phosphatase
VRHGEAQANAQGRYLGHRDSALSVKGHAQAADAAKRLLSEKATRLYTSDLGRCMETSNHIAHALELYPVPDSRLRELNFGQWDGKTYEEVMRSTDRDLLEKWYLHPFDISPPGGETLRELGRRVDEWLEQTVAVIHPNETVVIVSHGGTIRWFQSKWLMGDASAYWQTTGVLPGGSVTAVWDGRRFIP